MKTITVAGSGVLGSQIAFHAAFHGYNVALYDISDAVLHKARGIFNDLAASYQHDVHASERQTNEAVERVRFTSDLGEALSGAELVIEAIPEVLEIKQDFFRKAGALAAPETVFATNTSTLLPSQFAADTGRPERLLALHFSNRIWLAPVVEVMGHAGTDNAVFEYGLSFVRSLQLMPLPLYKEQPGYITNSLIMPWLASALKLWADDVTDYQTIDRTWMVAGQSSFVPFAVVDLGGVALVQTIMLNMAQAQGDALLEKAANRLKTDYVDKGKLGRASGEGFYSYPNPAFMGEGFLKAV
ncbi:3-hydroxyacyl-CoA dehydrogenase [Agrobacterium leguminum]|uniref:3-hydroxyacyl-CoA dehydrogenase n=1 Tax=Agrobacterium leguminum TaxID=2792015 RepID=UPI00272B00CB|nr:3-hydroxyacyl-CoA dehydrogenase [Agrobacterium leguminum]WLD96328.1 3-hydroxyacyl-CoA dehydrogenase [Agrobacterium leguminum]